jgi:[protein-PII] uridylyltransferase
VALLDDAAATDVALVAVGGHGRRELAPGSDLDLVLLHRGRKDIGKVADAVWYPVWDSGVPLDHSVRTVREALDVAGSDLKAALGLLDARHVAGDQSLTRELVEAWRPQWRRTATKRLPELVAATRERHARAGELAFLLEPDLKETRGGLRDVHAIRQAGAAWVVEQPGEQVTRAYDVLLDVRVELHRATGRGTDALRLQDQDAVARALGDPDADALMHRVAAAARTISWELDHTLRRIDAWVAAATTRRRGRPASWTRLDTGVIAQDGEVHLARDADVTDAGLPLRIGAAAARAGLPMSAAALSTLAASTPGPDEPWPAAVRDELVGLLGAGHGAVGALEALDHHGLLVRLLPEWAAVRSRPQRNAYHRFTVDRHLCEAAANAAALTRRVSRPDLLLVGSWLHDIGKGFPGDHTEVGMPIVDRIALRMGFPAEDVGTLVALVEHHLLLPDVATRRDLDDPATAEAVAKAVGDVETLHLLAALTEADSLATGPAAWSEWKAGLLAELVRRTAAVLAGVPSEPAAVRLTDRQRALVDAREPCVEVDGTTLTVVAPDRHGVLSRICGAMALHRLDVRSASVTVVDGMAVDVVDTEPAFDRPPDWPVVVGDVRRALAGRLAVEARLAERERAYPARTAAAAVAPARVLVDEAASAVSTVIEVRAPDAVGVLYRITRALADCDLDIRSAKVVTLGHEVVDTFYLVGADGRRIEDRADLREIERAILAAMARGPAD